MARLVRIALWAIGGVLGAALVVAALLIWGPHVTPSNVSSISPEYVNSFGTKGGSGPVLRRPIGVATSSNRTRTVYVSDAATNRIHAYTHQGEYRFSFGEPGDGPGELQRPMHMSVGPEENLYVAEYLNDRISVFEPDGTFVRHIVSEKFDAPAGVDVAEDGTVYVADFYNHVVRVFDAKGNLQATWGEPGRIFGGQLHYPTDVAVAPDGTLWVADAYNDRLQRFVSGESSEIGGWGLFGWAFGFDVADGLGVDPKGRVYGTDFYNGRIRVFDTDGTPIATFGAPGDGPGQFDRPNDIAFVSARAYVVDFGNARIQIWNLHASPSR
jgi:DNA-binding beta-propeller fold protein YncE